MKHLINRVLRTIFLGVAVLFPLSTYAQIPNIPNIPQIPAFLPTVDQVPATQAMPLDGTWLINTLKKKVRIEGGRVYAVDEWLHLFVLQIQPGMVVIKNLVPTGPGKYAGEDLPLMGTMSATVQNDKSIAVTVQTGFMGAVNYKLIPIQLDNMQWYIQEMQAAGLNPPTSAPASAPAYQFTSPGAYAPPAQPSYYAPQAPAYAPSNPAAGYQAPVYQAPAGQQPLYQAPPIQQPVQQPVYQAPPIQQPMYQAPAVINQQP